MPEPQATALPKNAREPSCPPVGNAHLADNARHVAPPIIQGAVAPHPLEARGRCASFPAHTRNRSVARHDRNPRSLPLCPRNAGNSQLLAFLIKPLILAGGRFGLGLTRGRAVRLAARAVDAELGDGAPAVVGIVGV